MLTAAAIVVADMVGVGVFTSLGFQVQGIPSGFSLLLLWVVGGCVALCGVFSYGELAAMFPRSSGEYNFLRQAYHPAVGVLAGWMSGTVGFAAPVSLAAMAFGEYGKAIVPGAPPLLLGLGVVWVVTLVGLLGLQHTSRFQMIWTLLKVGLILSFLVAGFVLGTPQPISFMPSATDASHILSASFAISLVFVMYSYSGWNAATYITGEMHDPQRSVPRSLLIGTIVVIVLYVALNALFLYTTPISQLAGQLDVAVIAGKHIFGDLGGRIVGGLICLGLVSSINAMMWIGPARHDDDGRRHPNAADVRPPVGKRRADHRDPVSGHGRDADAPHPELRGGAGIHPVRPAVLLVSRRARRDQAAHHPARSAAALSRMGLSGDAAHLPIGDGVHDVLPLARAPDAVADRRTDDGLGPRTLLPVTNPDVPGRNAHVRIRSNASA